LLLRRCGRVNHENTAAVSCNDVRLYSRERRLCLGVQHQRIHPTFPLLYPNSLASIAYPSHVVVKRVTDVRGSTLFDAAFLH
jgi:hypothetical protein